MRYMLKEPTGKFFRNASFYSWEFTENKDEADKFSTLEEAKKMKATIDEAVLMTYWDYSDVEPYPKIVMG